MKVYPEESKTCHIPIGCRIRNYKGEGGFVRRDPVLSKYSSAMSASDEAIYKSIDAFDASRSFNLNSEDALSNISSEGNE